MQIVVNCASHRARQRLLATLHIHGAEPEAVYSFEHAGGHGGSYRIPAVLKGAARAVKGITVSRSNPEDWMRCWSMR